MKYLFLDIDGVLNHEEWYINRCPQLKDKFEEWWESCFDPECVKRVNRIIQETGASLVVSSSWKVDRNLKDMFERVGLPTEFDVTPELHGSIKFSGDYWPDRGEEVAEFLKNHPCDNYVILDDDMDFSEDQIKNHFVHCCAIFEQAYKEGRVGETGLTEYKTEQTINKLNQVL